MFTFLVTTLLVMGIGMGFWFGYKIGRQITVDELQLLTQCQCPHGHWNWDDCPNCSH
jgi:hypothetical protein